MDIEKALSFIRNNFAVIIVTTIFVASATWQIASTHFEERIRVVEMQMKFCEQKLKEPAAFTAPSPVPPPQSRTAENTAKTPTTASVRYPSLANPASLSKDEVRDLARFYGLLTEWQANPHLKFKEGDISYWYEQGLSEQVLKVEFESRRQVLQRAEATGNRIPTQGDLSHQAQQIKSQLLPH